MPRPFSFRADPGTEPITASSVSRSCTFRNGAPAFSRPRRTWAGSQRSRPASRRGSGPVSRSLRPTTLCQTGSTAGSPSRPSADRRRSGIGPDQRRTDFLEMLFPKPHSLVLEPLDCSLRPSMAALKPLIPSQPSWTMRINTRPRPRRPRNVTGRSERRRAPASPEQRQPAACRLADLLAVPQMNFSETAWITFHGRGMGRRLPPAASGSVSPRHSPT